MDTTSAHVTEREAEKYDRVWQVPEYRVRCHSLGLWRERRDLFPASFQSGIDIGCGLGRILPVWVAAGIDAWGVDLVPDRSLDQPDQVMANGACLRDRVYAGSLWDWLPPGGQVFDVGVCADLMEHIPRQYVPAVLRHLAQYCRMVVFKIANFHSRSLGDELHLTRERADWWAAQMTGAMGPAVRRRSYRTTREEYVFTWTAA